MATLTLTLVAGATSQKVLTFNATDAQRILVAFRNVTRKPNATADDFLTALTAQLKDQFLTMVVNAERSEPTPPSIT